MPVMLKLVSVATVDNPVIGDIFLKNGSYVVVGETTGPAGSFGEAVAQKIRNRFLQFKSEWFLDKREGLPWIQTILIKSPDLAEIRTIFRDTINNTSGVAETTKMEVTFDVKTRILRMTFKANLTDGTELDSENFAPFILEV